MKTPRKPRLRRRIRTLSIGDLEFATKGLSHRIWDDIYHRTLTISWPTFFALAGAGFLFLNTVFALLYMLDGRAIANQYPHGFAGAFFFSVETLATVGYGDMHPQTIYAHLVATVEIFTGMGCIALATGLVFARFSRPRAKILIADHPVVRPIDGMPTLMIRAANARQNVIVSASAKLDMLRMHATPEGFQLRKIYTLRLVRDMHPNFMLSWSLMHVIDGSSPLYGETAQSLDDTEVLFMLTIEGVDETTSQTMLARRQWASRELRWGHRYLDLIHYDKKGHGIVDYNQFHKVEPL